MWYSISLEFYDSRGNVIIPDTLIALELPPPTQSSVHELSPGASVDSEYSLERLREIIDFGGAKFAVAKYSIDDVDFRLFPNTDLDVGPGFRLSNVVTIR